MLQPIENTSTFFTWDIFPRIFKYSPIISGKHMKIQYFLFVILCSALLSCGGNSSNASKDPTVQVYKLNGVSQCDNSPTGIDVEEMQAELVDAGIDVICSQVGNDGKAHCESCGCPSGEINIYEIHSQNVEDAVNLDYELISELENHQVTECG